MHHNIYKKKISKRCKCRGKNKELKCKETRVERNALHSIHVWSNHLTHFYPQEFLL